jgi:hypothetical protein
MLGSVLPDLGDDSVGHAAAASGAGDSTEIWPSSNSNTNSTNNNGSNNSSTTTLPPPPGLTGLPPMELSDLRANAVPWSQTNLGDLSGAMYAAESAAAAAILDDDDDQTPLYVDELQDMLESLNLSHIRSTLQAHQCDLDSLKLMSEDDLREMGIAKGPRVKLMKRLQAELYGLSVGGTTIGDGFAYNRDASEASSQFSEDFGSELSGGDFSG